MSKYRERKGTRKFLKEVFDHDPISSANTENRRIVRLFVAWIAEQLSTGNPVSLRGVGTITATWRKGRTFVTCGVRVLQPDTLVLKFKSSQWMKERLIQLAATVPMHEINFFKPTGSGANRKWVKNAKPRHERPDYQAGSLTASNHPRIAPSTAYSSHSPFAHLSKDGKPKSDGSGSDSANTAAEANGSASENATAKTEAAEVPSSATEPGNQTPAKSQPNP